MKREEQFTLDELRKTRIYGDRTAKYYLKEKPEKFAILLATVLKELYSQTEHQVVFVFNVGKNEVITTALMHNGNLVDIRGRHFDTYSVLDDIDEHDSLESEIDLLPYSHYQLRLDMTTTGKQNTDDFEKDEIQAL